MRKTTLARLTPQWEHGEPCIVDRPGVFIVRCGAARHAGSYETGRLGSQPIMVLRLHIGDLGQGPF